MEQKRIAVLIPCYNEEQTISKVICDFKQVFPQATIYVYDNNSTDRTAEIARQEGAVVRYEKKQGKGNVIRSMFQDITADCYVMIDGDDTYPAEFAPEMAEKILNGEAEMVVGDRLSSTYFQENKRPFHNIGNVVVRGLINMLFKNNVKDIMTGYRAFSFNFVKTFPVISEGFEIETEMTIHALDKKLHIENVIIEYRDRPEGSESKLDTYSDGFKVLRTIGRLFKNYKPFFFFITLSIMMLIIGLFFFVPVFLEYLETGLVLRFPTLIVSGFIMLTAILSFFAGLILDVINHNQRLQFEVRLNEMALLKQIYDRKDRLVENETATP
ncbi:glycosyl transferase [Jeotgalibaca sp. PTS2502]|uniref:DPM/DPG synthase family glycosyltransferase n=1 Tax=Jeotgalibaca sp. PTS2502 TaxID=1903686 RepID=UPI000973D121|nr:DPM/DPG synthase family glycosyltransferase [Jeotgalibaca sp. PTS2502]APZ49228.1 glycosyl transferase [Jeotgalibaca sp. PTS2502]